MASAKSTIPRGNRFIDIRGETFGRLTVIDLAPDSPKKEAAWTCRCSCGTVTTIKGSALRRGKSKSCGCLQRFTEEERCLAFWSKVSKSAGCWTWIGASNGNGYGRFWIPGRRMQFAHRVAYEIMFGPIPDGLTIDHLCRNRACVNPKHLEAVPLRENILRGCGPSARESRQTHCKRGHAFTGENTYKHIGPWGTKRVCIACRRQADRNRRKS
jgi:hypothetical protein